MLCDSSLSRVSDAELVNRLTKLVQSGRRVTAAILMHLAELEDRRLHLKAGHNSLFSYCLAVHGMSEDEACRRIEVARLGRRFNSIFGLLASGALSLSVAALLKDCLTDQNQTSLLAAVSGKSVRAAREELAARFPIPDVPSSIRKLPQRSTSPLRTATTAREHETPLGEMAASPASPVSARFTRDIAGSPPEPSALLTSACALTGASVEISLLADSTRDIAIALIESSAPATATRDVAGNLSASSAHSIQTCDTTSAPRAFATIPCVEVSASDGDRSESSGRPSDDAELLSEGDDSTGRGRIVCEVAPTSRTAKGSDRARVEPIASARYRVQFTANLAQKQKLELAADLMSHRNPSRDLAAIVERGLELLIEELRRTRLGKSSRPQSAPRKSRKARVSNETRRIVVERDGLRCSFMDKGGQRCEARAFLEFDHQQPLGKDGCSEPINVRLLCRAHNRYCAELEYGRSKIEREIARSKDGRGTTRNSVRE